MMSTKSLLLVPLASLVLAACPGAPPEEPETASREDVGEALIGFIERCQPETFITTGEPVLAARVDSSDAIAAALDELVNNDNTTFDEEKAAECVAALEDAECDDDTGDACDDVFEGTIAEGEACAFAGECVDGTGCFFATDGECGTCEPLAGEGDSCTAAVCDEDLACVDGVCVPQEPDEAGPAAFEVGDACTEDDNCERSNTGLACVDGACAAVTVVGDGDACNDTTLYCENQLTTHLCVGDVCTARPGPGEACFGGVLCDDSVSVCDAGSCVAGGGEGDACVGDADACQLFTQCNEGVCTSLFAAPEPLVCE